MKDDKLLKDFQKLICNCTASKNVQTICVEFVWVGPTMIPIAEIHQKKCTYTSSKILLQETNLP
jgi:hypothetical protein